MMLEFCCEPDSMMGTVGDSLPLTVIRLNKDEFDLSRPDVISHILNVVKTHPGISLWGSLPCTVWCSWQYMSMHKHGEPCRRKLMARRKESMKLLTNELHHCRTCCEAGGRRDLFRVAEGVPRLGSTAGA